MSPMKPALVAAKRKTPSGVMCPSTPRRLYPAELADGRLELCDTKEATAEGADALVICTEWKRFMAPNFEHLASGLRQKLIFDGRNLYDPERLRRSGRWARVMEPRTRGYWY